MHNERKSFQSRSKPPSLNTNETEPNPPTSSNLVSSQHPNSPSPRPSLASPPPRTPRTFSTSLPQTYTIRETEIVARSKARWMEFPPESEIPTSFETESSGMSCSVYRTWPVVGTQIVNQSSPATNVCSDFARQRNVCHVCGLKVSEK